MPVLLAPFVFLGNLKANDEASTLKPFTKSLIGLKGKPVSNLGRKKTTRQTTDVGFTYDNGYEVYKPLSECYLEMKDIENVQYFSDWKERLANGQGQLMIAGVEFTLSKSFKK